MNKIPALILSLSLSAQAQDLKLSDEFLQAEPRIKLYMAYAEYKMGHHELARRMWLATDGSGRAEALFNLANLYVQGTSVDKDPQRGMQLYRESAEAGSRAAAYQLGLIYLHSPVFQNPEQARHWLTVAALDGDSDAANLLASMEGDDPADPLSQVEVLLIEGNPDQALALLQTLAAASPPDYRAITR